MGTITPVLLSESTDGIGVLVTGTNTGTADLIHTATATADEQDEISLWVHNTHTEPVDLTIEFGAAAQPMVVPIPADDGAYEVLPGWRLANAKTVKAFASVANVLKLTGHVNRYGP